MSSHFTVSERLGTDSEGLSKQERTAAKDAQTDFLTSSTIGSTINYFFTAMINPSRDKE